MSDYDSYIICGTPGSGSTLLCNLLRDAGCGRPRSYFRRQSIARIAAELGIDADPDPLSATFAGDYVDAVMDAGRGGADVFGLRVMYENFGEMLDILALSQKAAAEERTIIERTLGRVLYIHLRRDDKVAQAISLLKAEHSGLWHIAADGAEIERTGEHREPAYNGPRIASLVDGLIADDAAWDGWFSRQGLQPLRIAYEHLAREPHVVVADILTRLGSNPAIAASLAVSTGKLGDEKSAEWGRRFREEYPPA